MDPRIWEGHYEFSRLPRVRGDGPQYEKAEVIFRVAPPCTRGWTLMEVFPEALGMGSPVYAGMDRGSSGYYHE